MALFLGFAALLTTAAAQASNPDIKTYGCDHLSCSSSALNQSICGLEAPSGVGVGFTDAAVNLTDSTDLSFTLIDGYPLSISQSFPLINYTTRSLYLGASSDANLQDQAPGCALMMQYDSATFPYSGLKSLPDSFNDNTTACPSPFTLSDSLSDLSALVKDFVYTNSSLPRCESLAAFVEYSLNHNNGTLGAYATPLISVTGGAIAGPDFEASSAQIVYNISGGVSSDTCAPVGPSDYQLYDVLAATQILRSDLSADQGISDGQTQNQTYGGRDGFSPIISVLFDDDGGSAREVDVFCMHIYSTAGQQLPYSTIGYTTPTSGASSGAWMSVWGITAGVATMVWSLL